MTGLDNVAGILSMLSMTGMSPAMLIPKHIPRRHLRNDICYSCFEKIPDGKPGRKCKKCRTPSGEVVPNGKTLTVKEAESAKDLIS